MTVSHENTAEDAFNWHYYQLTHTLTGRRSLWKKRLLHSFYSTLIVVVGANVYPLMRGDILRSVVFYLTVPPVLFLISYGLSVACFKDDLQRYIRRHIRKTKTNAFLGVKTLDLLPEGLRIAWDCGYAVHNWSTLRGLTQTQTHLIFIYDDSNFVMVPKRAFRNDVQAQEFAASAERLRAGVVEVESPDASSIAVPLSASPWWRNRSAVDTSEEKASVRQRLP